MLILIFGSKSDFGDDFGQYHTKRSFMSRFGQTHLKSSVVVATAKVQGDQKLLERVCYKLKLKVTKLQVPRPNSFRKTAGGGGGRFSPPRPDFSLFSIRQIFDEFQQNR